MAHRRSEAASSPPGPGAPFPSADTSWAQTDCAATAWTRAVYSISLLPPPPSLQTSPTWRQNRERNRSGIHNQRDVFEPRARLVGHTARRRRRSELKYMNLKQRPQSAHRITEMNFSSSRKRVNLLFFIVQQSGNYFHFSSFLVGGLILHLYQPDVSSGLWNIKLTEVINWTKIYKSRLIVCRWARPPPGRLLPLQLVSFSLQSVHLGEERRRGHVVLFVQDVT